MKVLSIYSKTPGSDRYFETIKDLKQVRVELPEYPGHVKRWSHIPAGLTGQIIFNDTDDVIYQGGLPELTGIITSPEGVLHKDTVWKQWCVGEYEVLLDNPVYNVGGFSMPAELLYDYARFTLKNHYWDQLAFNLWLLNHVHQPRIDIFLALYDNFNLMEKKADGWYLGNTKPCFIHSNGIKREL